MQLGFAILLPDEVHNAIRRLQLDIAQACGGNPALKLYPHITLKQPFHAKELAPVESYFDELASAMTPIRIEMEGVRRFEKDEVIFVDVPAPPALEELRLAVLAELGSRFGVKPRDIEDDRYHFHATLAYNLTPGAFERAWKAVRDNDVRFSFETDALGLFYYTGDEWILYKRGRLDRTSSAISAN
jgi:2'-5' RNA ligase